MAGEVLKKRREELGLEIKEVAERIKIKAEYLSSIEEDRFEKLPVAVYTIGYIRCYAEFLQVDPEPILAIYSGHLSYPPPSTILPVSSSMKKVPFSYYVIPLLIFLLIGLTIFIVVRQNDYDSPLRQLTAPSTPVQTAIPQPVPAPTISPVVPQPVQPEKTQPEPPMQTVSPVIPPPVQPVPDVRPQPRERAAAGTGHTIEITAQELTWVQITYAGGKSEEALLRPGTAKTWNFPDTAVLKMGNAGGAKLSLDGRDIGIPGSKGQIMSIALPENRRVVKESGTDDRQ
ncbi:MAG TPA: RodZ domain-containing protein [Thermodesulfovibrionales bacterium]|nr:RodZ domain-containing protein [Thermodesulfovibrionales bacterium]